MIDVGSVAPGFKLSDHLGREHDSASYHNKAHILLLFYPLDFTPT